MSEIATFMKVARLPAAQRLQAMAAHAPAARPAANPGAQTALLEKRIVNQAAKGRMASDVVPQHLNEQVIDRQAGREAAKLRLDGRKELGAVRGHASTPERQAAQAQLQQIPQYVDGKSNPAFFDARKAYNSMPHSPEHHAKVQEHVAARRGQQAQGAQAALTQRADRLSAAPAMPENYQHGKAMARAAFDVNNQWHRNAPAFGALAGGAVGALTADPEQGESRLTRGLMGAAAGGAAGYGVRRAAPHVAGFMHQPPTA